MNKSVKAAAILSMFAIFAGGAFAQEAEKKSGDEKPKISRVHKPGFNRNMRMPMGMHGFGGFGMKDEKDSLLIGQVKSIDAANGKITVVNTDGKKIEVAVTPFTHISLEKKREKPAELKEKKEKSADNAEKDQKEKKPRIPPMPKEYKISDIKEGNWIMVNSFKTETKHPAAKMIIVKAEK